MLILLINSEKIRVKPAPSPNPTPLPPALSSSMFPLLSKETKLASLIKLKVVLNSEHPFH